ncbi:PIR protein [Plasmodium vivax]|uniref:VIR protein n=1 Tax=Plasmodium vivax TaxID=5855 RepID=A0A565A6T0_PLAVI|nr:PIR protein [Plasmodium vivax]
MSLEAYEKNFPLNRFIDQIEKFYLNCQNFLTIPCLKDIILAKNETLKNIGCAVYRGYTYLAPQNDIGKRINFCNYLNLWLDEQKSIYVTNNSNNNNEQWKLIDELWNCLKQNYDKSRHCDRKEGTNSPEIRKRIDLMVYCVNRDYFKSLCEKSIHPNRDIDQKCFNFSRFTDKYYEKFYTENDCLDKTHDPQDYRYHISNECTLYNMSKTFPVIDLQNKAILDNGNIRTPIKECTNAVEVEGQLQEQTQDITDVPPEVPESSDDLDEPGNGHSESGDVRTGSKSGFPESIELAFPSTTAVTSPSDKPSNPVYYAGLSTLGVFFTSMVLYKYTTLGPLIRSLVSKKEKLRQTTNKHLAEQWLQRTSEYMDSNSENAHYNFPYHSMQN